MKHLVDDATRITEILRDARSVTVIGLSPRPDRDSHRVARYLQDVGYRVILVRPGTELLLGERCHASLDAVEVPVDVVCVFRRPEHVPAIAAAAIRKRVRASWMQLGIAHPAAAGRLRAANIAVVQDRCMMVEHRRQHPIG